MKAYRLFKCQLCGKLYKNGQIIEVPTHAREQSKETYDKLNDVVIASFPISQVCFCEDGRIGQCLFAGFEMAEDAQEKPEA